VSRLRRLQPERWLLNPAVMASLMTFVLSYNISNVLFFLPEDTVALVGVVPVVTPEMTKLMWLVLLGAVAMWLGYWSPIAMRLTNAQMCNSFRTRFLRKSAAPRWWVLPVLLAVSLLSRLAQISLGIFGYSSTYDRLLEMGSVSQYLSMASSLGKLALAISALQFFSHRSSTARCWLFGLLSYEAVFGVLSGFKSQVAMPFVVVGVCQYLVVGRITASWIVVFAFSLVAAYAVIEPFRIARNQDLVFKGTSIVEIFETVIGATSSASGTSASTENESLSLVVSMLSRSSLAYIGSLGIGFADQNPVLPADSPNFLGDLFLAPFHAWIPRIIWESKPLGVLGVWYTQVVIGASHSSSTAMGPFTYLYFAGGAAAVAIGFCLLGIIQRILFMLTHPTRSVGGAIVYLGALSSAVIVDSNFSSIFISFARELPLLIILQTLLFSNKIDCTRVQRAG
jgi:hypothetical protein